MNVDRIKFSWCVAMAVVIGATIPLLRPFAQDKSFNLSSENRFAVASASFHFKHVPSHESNDEPALEIITRRCLECHSAELAESGLALDERESIMLGGDSGEPVIDPSQPNESLLVQLIRGDDPDRQMPPDGDTLTASEIEAIVEWISRGAPMPEEGLSLGMGLGTHWAFQPLTRPTLPESDSPLIKNPIDAFIQNRLAEQGLSLSPSADRVTLIRRLYLTLLGIPPTPEQIERFVSDSRLDAYEHLVDRLLASPQFGERWASHWLDIARFGETNGFETNRERPSAFHYRDYVIDSFNLDRPYDQFIMDQVAGDRLGQPVGTGFLVAGPYDVVKSPDVQLTLMQRQDELADIVHTTSTAFLGLTLGCARCHHHKFDPITQRDYYAVQAVFAGVNHGESELPPSPFELNRIIAQESKLQELQAEVAELISPSDALVVIDELPSADHGQRVFVEQFPNETSVAHQPGIEVGQADDPGETDRIANFSKQYHWWQNRPGETIGFYRLYAQGAHRIWLSWGCGWHTHSQDVLYLLDRDGRLETSDDRFELATVDQQLFADGSPVENQNSSLWSGLYDAGIHQLVGNEIIIIQGGESGTAVTADDLLLQPISNDNESIGPDRDRDSDVGLPTILAQAAPINSRLNVVAIDPVAVNAIRLEVSATNNGAAPCVDEFEIWSGDVNVARDDDVQLTASGTISGYEEIHQLRFINDGHVGNAKSWISESAGQGWVQLDFHGLQAVDRLSWGRDRLGQYQDRTITAYQILGRTESGTWTVLASHEDHLILDREKSAQPIYDVMRAASSRREALSSKLTQLKTIQAELKSVITGKIAYIGQFQPPPVTHLLYRGDPSSPREVVEPNSIESFGGLSLSETSSESERRTAFANWLVQRDHPLTARVMVNRLWQHLFGQGIVTTPSDFGINGVSPSHPQLLDWLAAEFVGIDSSGAQTRGAHHWSTKSLIRLIVCSQTFRQSNRPHELGMRLDANAQLLWRFPPRRLSAEAIRDSMLMVCGNLAMTGGGPGFSGFEVELENVRHYFPRRDFGPDTWRRMIYMTKVRQEQDAVFGAFDCPDGSQVQPKRSRSTTPTQALNLFNSSFTMSQAHMLAESIVQQSALTESTAVESTLDSSSFSDTESQVTTAFERVLGREPDDFERADAKSFVEQHGLAQLCRVLMNSNEFLFIP